MMVHAKSYKSTSRTVLTILSGHGANWLIRWSAPKLTSK